jgi:hypothetical protein
VTGNYLQGAEDLSSAQAKVLWFEQLTDRYMHCCWLPRSIAGRDRVVSEGLASEQQLLFARSSSGSSSNDDKERCSVLAVVAALL